MKIRLTLNGKKIEAEIKADTLLLDLVREKGCYSVKRGCETSNCGLCTVWLDGKPVLSCSVLAARADGHEVTTLEGLQKESEEFADFLAREGADQCGFCSPGLIMNGTGTGKSDYGRGAGVPGRKLMPVYRICRPAPCPGKIFKPEEGGVNHGSEE